MARLPRIVIPNTPHHITQRGNRRQATFFCNDDYVAYLELMQQACKKVGVQILAYCLMPNHTHLVVVPPEEEALRVAIGGMHEQYTRQVNWQRGWRGHLWQGRFFSVPMDEGYLAACIRYVELNPVRAKLEADPFNYRWSSAKAHLEKHESSFVDIWPMLARFPDWRSFLAVDVDPMDLAAIRRSAMTGRPLGDEAFLKRIEVLTGRDFAIKPPGPKPKSSA